MEEAVLTGESERPDAGAAIATTATAVPAAGAAGVGGPEGPAVPPEGPAVAPATGRARAAAPRWAQLPYAIVLAAAAGGLAWMWLGTGHVRTGMTTVASALLLAAVLRLVLPERAAGLLASRRRVADVLVLASLGAGILAAVLLLPSPA